MACGPQVVPRALGHVRLRLTLECQRAARLRVCPSVMRMVLVSTIIGAVGDLLVLIALIVAVKA